MARTLDNRLSDAFMRLLRDKHPTWVHQEEIYQYVEGNVNLTKKQRELHIQKAGQIEENWQHDLRNLQHSIKRKCLVINPEKEIWGLPSEQTIPESKINSEWLEVISKVRTIDNCEIVGETITIDNVEISKQLFLERVSHLILCGGLLPSGRMHVWSSREKAIIQLTDSIDEIGNWICYKNIIIDNSHLQDKINQHRSKVDVANKEGQALIKERKKKGMERRTVTIQRDSSPDWSSTSIPWAVDRDGRQIQINSKNIVYNKEGYQNRGYHCPGCGRDISATIRTAAVRSHWRHRPSSAQLPVTPESRSCNYRSTGSNSSYHTQSLLPLLNQHLNVRLQNQGFGIWALVTDAGDDSGHGFPVDEEKPVREIIEHDNLDTTMDSFNESPEFLTLRILGTLRRGSSTNLCEPLFINNPTVSASISFKRKGLRNADFVQAPPLKEGNVFQLNDLSDLNASGPGIGRLRPSLKYQKTSDKIVDYNLPLIGVIFRDNSAKKSKFTNTIRKKLMSGFYIEVFFCENPEHVKYLETEFNVTISSEKAIDRELEVFVRKPIWGNPVGKKLIHPKLGVDIEQDFELIANNIQVRTNEDGSETISFPHAKAIFSSYWTNPKEIRFGNASQEQPWATLHMPNELVQAIKKRSHHVIVDGSINYPRSLLKPPRGIQIQPHQSHCTKFASILSDELDLYKSSLIISHETDGGNPIKINIVNSPPVVTVGIGDSKINDIFFDGALSSILPSNNANTEGRIESESEFRFLSIDIYSEKGLEKRRKKLTKGQAIDLLRQEYEIHSVTKIQMSFEFQLDGVELPTIIIDDSPIVNQKVIEESEDDGMSRGESTVGGSDIEAEPYIKPRDFKQEIAQCVQAIARNRGTLEAQKWEKRLKKIFQQNKLLSWPERRDLQCALIHEEDNRRKYVRAIGEHYGPIMRKLSPLLGGHKWIDHECAGCEGAVLDIGYLYTYPKEYFCTGSNCDNSHDTIEATYNRIKKEYGMKYRADLRALRYKGGRMS